MRIEIDQSGKIEETHRDTVLAMANGVTETVRITARTKRRLQEAYRRAGRPRDYIVGVFSAALYLLVKRYVKVMHEIVIDTEYPGHEQLIIAILESKLGEERTNFLPLILFRSIGKRSNAHISALTTFKKPSKASAVLNYEAIIKQCSL